MNLIYRQPFLLSLIAGMAFVVAVCMVGNPIWQSDDDVAMSMIAQGYGLGADGSPVLFFSSPLWGLLVQHLPWAGGVPGYNIATLMVQALCATGWIYCLLRQHISPWLIAPLLGTVFSVSVVHPQFSVNAGMATLTGVMLLMLYLPERKPAQLVAACLFGFMGFLIRDFSCLLVLLVAVPFLELHRRATYRTLRLPIILLLVAVGGAYLANGSLQQGERWQFFREFNWARTPLTDFTLGERLQQNPALLEKHGYSPNDMALLSKWFFADRALADPQRLRQLNTDGNESWFAFSSDVFERSLSNLFTAQLVPLWLVAGAWLIMLPQQRRRLVFSVGLVLLVAMVLGAAGRPGMLRIYYPLAATLVSLPLMAGGPNRGQKVPAVIAALALAAQLYGLIALFQSFHFSVEFAQRDAQRLPEEPIALWADATPLQYRYPVLGSNPHLYRIQYYPLGTFTYMPGARSLRLEMDGKGLIGLLRKPEGVWMLTNDYYLELLRNYCREHFGVAMQVKTVAISEATPLKRVSCSGGNR